MPVVDPGEGVLELVRSSIDRVIIAAPYIKSHTLRSLISVIPDSVSEFVCITRWLPEDIATGVCDIEIFDDVTKHNGGELRVHPHLHAKFYSNNNQSLVGSANLTGRGLGWHTPANVELLVALPGDFQGLQAWEATLLASSVTATKDLRDQILAEAARIKKPIHHLPEVEESEESNTLWVPTCTVPDRLWSIYRGQGADSIVTSAYDAAQSDLAALFPPMVSIKHYLRPLLLAFSSRCPLSQKSITWRQLALMIYKRISFFQNDWTLTRTLPHMSGECLSCGLFIFFGIRTG